MDISVDILDRIIEEAKLTMSSATSNSASSANDDAFFAQFSEAMQGFQWMARKMVANLLDPEPRAAMIQQVQLEAEAQRVDLNMKKLANEQLKLQHEAEVIQLEAMKIKLARPKNGAAKSSSDDGAADFLSDDTLT
jgi:hypothetical protein